jgi:hypothetical protein
MIVQEVLLDRVALVTEAEDKVADPEPRIPLHDVPKNRLASYFDHGLGPILCFLP